MSIHGDDITSLGFEEQLEWLHARLLERYELKFGGMLGPDETDVQNVMLLNRLIHYGRDATTIEADGRHVQILVNELKLEGANVVQTPGVSSSLKDEDVPLEGLEVQRYRSMAMRCDYLALDRPDINFAAKELARGMQCPKQSHFQGLKRLCRYTTGVDLQKPGIAGEAGHVF